MIYIWPEDEGQTLLIPINLSRNDSGNYKLRLINTTTRQEFEFDVEDSGEYLFYYSILFTPDETMPVGEYEYDLYDDSKNYSTGLMRYVDISQNTQFNEDTINNYTYRQDI